VKRRDMGSVLTCIVSDKLGPGEVSRDFVARMSQLLDCSGGILLSNSSIAVRAGLEALGLGPSDSVVLSALSPAWMLRAVRDGGFVPLLADVEPESGSLDPAEVAKQIGRGPKAIIARYSLGIVPDIAALRSFGIPIVEDVSQALGGKVGDIPCGSTGDITVVSLEPENVITCGGGAMVLAKGRSAAAALKKLPESSLSYWPLADMNAALGLSQLQGLERFVLARRELASAFSQSLLKSRHKTLVQKVEADNVLSSFPVLLKDGLKEARLYAQRKEVETVPAVEDSPVTLDEEVAASCPHARSMALRCLLFPLYPVLARKDVETISKVLSTLP
jgi:perosamine synthetase